MSSPQNKSSRRVLFIAFHFPPLTGSSGLLRSVKFCRYLPENGWEPMVLTAHVRAYQQCSQEMTPGISDLRVIRAFALDTRRHLSIKGRYLRHTALPDRWVSWVLGAVPAGLKTIWREKVEVIFSTYPIASAILIGYLLHRLSGRPWVVDFRDPLVEYTYPSDESVMAAHRWIEKQVVKHASLIVFTARSSLRMYQARYPNLSQQRFLLLPNGYDEEDFLVLSPIQKRLQSAPGPLRLMHAGTIYPDARDPSNLFAAIARLKREGRVDATRLLIDLRAPGFEDQYSNLLRDLKIEDMVRLLPALPYRESLADAAAADGLLLLQGPSCDRQIPAKAYEYLRTGKPILALTSKTGDTADLLHTTGGAQIADITSTDAIYVGLLDFMEAIKTGAIDPADPQKVQRYTRRQLSVELGKAFAQVANKQSH